MERACANRQKAGAIRLLKPGCPAACDITPNS
jgi:hypothetical protein